MKSNLLVSNICTDYHYLVFTALNILGTLYRVIQSNITDTDNLMKLLAEEKEIVDKPGAEELKNATGEIELDHVRNAIARSRCWLFRR